MLPDITNPATLEMMGINLRPMFLSHAPDATRVLLGEPIVCAICGEMHTFFINRSGRTRCFICDQPVARAREDFREFVESNR